MDFKRDKSIYSQIGDYLKGEMFGGKYDLGQKLPSVRELAEIVAVNPNTIVRVYAELEAEGLVYTESTSGKFVTKDEEFFNIKRKEYIVGHAREFCATAERCRLTKSEVLKILEELYGK